MSIDERLSQLLTLSKKWYPKLPKKFDTNILISKVHQQVFNEAVDEVLLDLLIDTNYFENVLWRKFDPDSSVNHTELILAVLIYDFEKISESMEDSLIQMVVEDKGFEDLFTRLLSITYNIQDSTNFRVVALVLKYFGILLSSFSTVQSVASSLNLLWDITILKEVGICNEEIDTKVNTMKNLPNDAEKANSLLKNKWIITLIQSFFKLVFVNKKITKNTIYFQQFLEQLLYTLAKFISNKDQASHLREMLEKMNFCATIKTLDPLKVYNFNRIQQLNDTLLYFVKLPKPSTSLQDLFYQLQQIIFKLHRENPKLLAFFLAPSIQSYSKTSLRDFLDLKFSESELYDICLQILQEKRLFLVSDFLDDDCVDKKELLLSIILEEILNPNDISGLGKEPTEVEIVDDFETKPKTPSIIDLIPLQMPIRNCICVSSQDYTRRTESNLKSRFVKELNIHLLTVLNRMKIDSSLKFQGSSKYFHSIKSIDNLDINTFKLSTNTPLEYSDGTILILELVQPNKFSKFTRVRDFGLNLLRVASIKSTDKKAKISNFTIECNSVEIESFESRVNFIVTLPKSSTTKAVKVLQNSLNDPYKSVIKSISQEIIETEISELDSETEDSTMPENKRRRTSEKVPEKSSSTTTFKGLTLNKDQNSVLTSIRSNKITIIDYKRSTGVRSILKVALEFHKHERWLVIVPSTAYLRQFLDQKVSVTSSYFKYGLESEKAACKDAVQNSILIITSMFDDTNTEITNAQILEYYEKEIKQLWKAHLLRNRDCVDDLLDKFPFREVIPKLSNKFNPVPATFQESVAMYKGIIQHIKFIKMMFPIWKKLKDPKGSSEVFGYLLNKYSSIITYDDYLGLVSQGETVKPFDNVVIINGKAESLSVIERVNEFSIKRLVIAGGYLFEGLQQCEVMKLQEKYNIRSQFLQKDNLNVHFSENLPQFNPGFAYNMQFVETGDNIEEAEFCVLLFQYMRLLGYPSDKIGIKVRSEYQKVLVEEIVATKCAVIDSKSTSFRFETPSVVFSEDRYNAEYFDYTIVSLHSGRARPFPRISGCLGNYIVGQPNQRTTRIQFPSETTLQICAGENYYTKQRTNNQKYSMEGKQHLELYVTQMTKARLASKTK